MEIDVRDESKEQKVTTIRFADNGVIKKQAGGWAFDDGEDIYYFPFKESEVDNMIKALKKLKEIAN